MSTVIVGVVSILSCVALVTWLARPAEFRVKAERPAPVRAPAPAVVPAPPLVPAPKLGPPAAAWPPVPAPPPRPDDVAKEPAAATRSPKPKRAATARSYLYVTKVPTRR